MKMSRGAQGRAPACSTQQVAGGTGDCCVRPQIIGGLLEIAIEGMRAGIPAGRQVTLYHAFQPPAGGQRRLCQRLGFFLGRAVIHAGLISRSPLPVLHPIPRRGSPCPLASNQLPGCSGYGWRVRARSPTFAA